MGSHEDEGISQVPQDPTPSHEALGSQITKTAILADLFTLGVGLDLNSDWYLRDIQTWGSSLSSELLAQGENP